LSHVPQASQGLAGAGRRGVWAAVAATVERKASTMPAFMDRAGIKPALVVALFLMSLQLLAQPSFGFPPAAHPKTQLECERKLGKKGVSWRKCFSTPPGSSCTYPFEVWKSGFTELGDGKYFKISFSEEQNNPLQVYKWATQKGVTICPHGVEYRLEKIYANGYNRIIPVHSGPHGGSFEYELLNEPPEEYTLVIRGAFLHPRQ
jgi:hypothetical protein